MAGLLGESSTTSCYSELSAQIVKTAHLPNSLLRFGEAT